PWFTPYQFAGNKPIQAIDLDGLEEWVVNSVTNSFKSLEGYKLSLNRETKESIVTITLLQDVELRKVGLQQQRDYPTGQLRQYNDHLNPAGEITSVGLTEFEITGWGTRSIVGEAMQVTNIGDRRNIEKVFQIENLKVDLGNFEINQLPQEYSERNVFENPVVKAYSSLVKKRPDLLTTGNVPYKSVGNYIEDFVGLALEQSTEGIVPSSIIQQTGYTVIDISLDAEYEASKEIKKAANSIKTVELSK